MPPKETLQDLLALADQPELEDFDRPARVAARLQWSLERAADWRRAHRAMDKRCDEAVDRLDEDAFEQLIEAEQAKVDAILAEIEAATKADRWPRELYWSL